MGKAMVDLCDLFDAYNEGQGGGLTRMERANWNVNTNIGGVSLAIASQPPNALARDV